MTSYVLHPPSFEQKKIIANLKDNNCTVDAIAGSGKTTTILHIANTYNTKNILLLTYNSKLRMETKTRTDNVKINNIDVHTYHSFCFQYNNKSNTDDGIRQVVESNTYELKKHYDIIMIDESQDITPLYYCVIHSILSKYNAQQKDKLRLCVLGDKRQSIYNFNNADSRFITMSDEIYNFNKHAWKLCNLSTSYRLSEKMVKFVNNCLLSDNSLNHWPNNTCTKNIDYYVANTFEEKKIFTLIIEPCIKKYGIENTIIIAPSIRATTFVRLINYISLNTEYATFIPTSDNIIVDKTILKNKLVFMSYHQSKGIERECVIVYGVDDSYSVYFDKGGNRNVCPNAIYVALTRAKQKLIMLHSWDNEFLGCLNLRLLPRFVNIKFMFDSNNKQIHKYVNGGFGRDVNVRYLKDNIMKRLNVLNGVVPRTNKIDDSIKKNYSVTEFIRHLSSDVINKISKEYVEKTSLLPESETIEVPQKVPVRYNGNLLFEEVSNVNGTFVPFYFEYHCLNRKNSSNIIKSLNSPYCIHNYESRGDVLRCLGMMNKYHKIMNDRAIDIVDVTKIKYFVLLIPNNVDTLIADDKIINNTCKLMFTSYDKNNNKHVLLPITTNRNSNNQIESQKLGIEIVQYDIATKMPITLQKIHLENFKDYDCYKIFLTYFDYLYYEGQNNYSHIVLNKLIFSEIQYKIAHQLDLNLIEMLKVTMIYDSYQNNYLNKLIQLYTCKYDWFSDINLKKCMDRLANELKIVSSKNSDNTKFEIQLHSNIVAKEDTTINTNFMLCGAVDCVQEDYIDSTTIYEFKFVKQLQVEHAIQILLYKFLFENNKDLDHLINNQVYYLYNIKTNEKIEIKCDNNDLEKMVQLIRQEKIKDGKNLNSDQEFKKKCDDMIRQIYIKNK